MVEDFLLWLVYFLVPVILGNAMAKISSISHQIKMADGPDARPIMTVETIPKTHTDIQIIAVIREVIFSC